MHRHPAPADLLHMARLGATRVKGCGPCSLDAAKGAKYGRAVRTELALAAVTVRSRPAIKRDRGYAQSWSAVRLAN
ncbi:MAG: hypothetical protein NVSMB69_01470 [Novosphingobium sp.]